MPSWTTHGPLSLSGSVPVDEKSGSEEAKSLKLRISNHPDNNSVHALLAPETISIFTTLQTPTPSASIKLVCSEGSDFVLSARTHPATPPLIIALTPTQQHNFRVLEGGYLDLQLYQPPSKQHSLVDLDAEVCILRGEEDEAVAVIDVNFLKKEFLTRYLGLVIATNEACVFEWKHDIEPSALQTGEASRADSLDTSKHEVEDQDQDQIESRRSLEAVQLLIKITACNTLDEAAQAEAIGYHCYRGLITPETLLYFNPMFSEDAGGCSEGEGGRRAVSLINRRLRPPVGHRVDEVEVYTNDGEMFPVKRKLLRPCIALTKTVRAATNTNAPDDDDENKPSTAKVDIDTLTFDRVLIFLECEALGRPLPTFGIHLIPPLLGAAQKLGLQSLQDYCEGRLGESAARIKWHRYADIEERNAKGECLLIMDGSMVLDVTRWLPEHPGGETIIPTQALNLDSSRFFEVYHASRESFLYIQQFYIGELLPEEREKVPQPEGSARPSVEFLRQLREYTVGFRLKDRSLGEGSVEGDEPMKVFKSF